MTVRWKEKAFLSLEQIFHYIEGDDPEAAIRTTHNIHRRIDELATFPNRGRIGRRQAPMPYIFVYRVMESSVEILQIRHGAQGLN